MDPQAGQGQALWPNDDSVRACSPNARASARSKSPARLTPEPHDADVHAPRSAARYLGRSVLGQSAAGEHERAHPYDALARGHNRQGRRWKATSRVVVRPYAVIAAVGCVPRMVGAVRRRTA